MSDLSVLMSIYNKENVQNLELALNSIFCQSIVINEVVLVKDGILTDELDDVISNYQNKLGCILKVIPLDKNQGLANALNVGLKHCTGDFIARMDTDDISTKDRFLKQIQFLKDNPDVDAVGCWISEIDENNVIIKEKVEYPLNHQELYKFFSKRDPMAHPTVMFRRAFFDKVKGYRDDLPLAEDTLLWYEGFKAGCKFANISYVGLLFRRNESFYRRRANWEKSINLLKFRLLHINRDLNYGIKGDLFAIAYFCISFVPSKVKKILYNFLR
ncbi:glycosyltransferase [Ursidibacter arcticus]